MARLGKFVDTSKCTACRACQNACKSWNDLPADIQVFDGNTQSHKDTTAKTYNFIQFVEVFEGDRKDWFFRHHACMHCDDAVCVKVCPEGAVYKTETGQVVTDQEKCIGCGYCAENCPFTIPKVDQETKKMHKCTQCFDRVSNGLVPACARICPTGALNFGDYNELMKTAEARLQEVKAKYSNANIYGKDFLGSTGTFYLLLDSPEVYGLPVHPTVPTSVAIWQNVIQPVGKVLPLAALGAVTVSAFLTRNVGKEGHDDHKKGGNN